MSKNLNGKEEMRKVGNLWNNEKMKAGNKHEGVRVRELSLYVVGIKIPTSLRKNANRVHRYSYVRLCLSLSLLL